MFAKPMVYGAGGMARKSEPGDNILNPVVTNHTTDANYTITAADMAGGIYQRSGTNTSRTDTLDTAANLIAAITQWNIGESFCVLLANAATANALTIAAGTGITLVGLATIAAGSNRLLVLRKDSATAITAYLC